MLYLEPRDTHLGQQARGAPLAAGEEAMVSEARAGGVPVKNRDPAMETGATATGGCERAARAAACESSWYIDTLFIANRFEADVN